MQAYKVGDTVVHWAYGAGVIVAIADKGLPGHPCSYYVIEGRQQTLWVPVEENDRSSLHLPTTRSDFKLLLQVLRSQGEKLSNNSYQRQDLLEKRTQKASPRELCLVIRDLNYRSQSQMLNSNDVWVLKQAQSSLLDEWELSLGTSREDAMVELEWVLKETPARINTF
jgi:RNA polymerase-interacting CarD/CdnL/TRCF family regulator